MNTVPLITATSRARWLRWQERLRQVDPALLYYPSKRNVSRKEPRDAEPKQRTFNNGERRQTPFTYAARDRFKALGTTKRNHFSTSGPDSTTVVCGCETEEKQKDTTAERAASTPNAKRTARCRKPCAAAARTARRKLKCVTQHTGPNIGRGL